MMTWSADFLQHVLGVRQAEAATPVSLFFLAAVLGRAVGSHLARRYASTHLLPATSVVTLGGFGIFWLALTTPVTLLGLFLTGLGTAGFSPLSLSVALSVAPAQADRANARVILGMGAAVLTIPFLMGWAADLLTIRYAYGLIAALLMGAVVITYLTNHAIAQTPAEHLAMASVARG
jgi:fucose permease